MEEAIKMLDEAKIDRNLLMKILEKYHLKEKFRRFAQKYHEEEK